jgi:hypothetical protein
MPRLVLLCAAALVVAGSVGSCARSAESRCPTDGTPAAAASDPPARPAPVREALWVADEKGRLRAFDGRTDRVSATIDIGRPAERIPATPLAGRGLIWVYRGDGEILLVDPVRARITKRTRIQPARPLGNNTPVYAHGALWIVQPGRLWRVSASGKVSALPLGLRPSAVTATRRWLWLAGGGRLLRVHPAGKTTTATALPVPAADLTGTRSGLFAVGGNSPVIWTLDPDTGATRSSIKVGGGEDVAYLLDTGAEPWAIGNCGNVMKVSATGQVSKTRVSDVSQIFPAAIAAGSLWVADEANSSLVRIDVRTGTVLARLRVRAGDPGDPAFIVVAGRRSVWLVDSDLANGVQRVDPATNAVVRLAPSKGVSSVTAVVAAPPRKENP